MCEKLGWFLVGTIIGVAVGYHLNEAVEFELTARQMAEARLAAEEKEAAAKKEDDGEMIDPDIEKELDQESTKESETEEAVKDTNVTEPVNES